MINKKLIVYGDSFADCHIQFHLTSIARHWFHYVVEHYTGQPYRLPTHSGEDRITNPDYLNRGTVGTSTFYSLIRFLEDLEEYNTEKVIFVFSSPRRVPLDSGPLASQVHMRIHPETIRQLRRESSNRRLFREQQGQIQAWYSYFFDHESFIRFLQQSIFDRVQFECKKRNIDLLFIETLSDIYEPDIRINFDDLEYPLIRNLETVARTEVDPVKFAHKNDNRPGHMNHINNKLCANEIIKCFDSMTPCIIDFDKVEGLDYSKETLSYYED